MIVSPLVGALSPVHPPRTRQVACLDRSLCSRAERALRIRRPLAMVSGDLGNSDPPLTPDTGPHTLGVKTPFDPTEVRPMTESLVTRSPDRAWGATGGREIAAS